MSFIATRPAVKTIADLALLTAVVSGVTGMPHASAQTLVGSPYVSPYTGWLDAPLVPARAGNWRLSLHNPTLMDTNNANPPTAGATNHDGTYQSDVLFYNNFTAPAAYDLAATMRTNDDDIIGLVWNYQDPNNYFRVGIRTQAAGTFGGTQGLAVQKIVNGVLTQISPVGTGAGAPTPITQAMINNRTPFELKVAVNGSNYQVLFDNTPIISGTDTDLAAGRKIGFQSWAQVSDTDENPDPPFWGTEVDSVSVKQGATTLFSESFAARPVQWRQVVMTNATGTVNTGNQASKEHLGNFGNDVNDPWILQHSNGFINATVNNIDFIGPAVAVNEPGSAAFTNYEMRTRIGTTDNDGLGVLVRVQDDNNFYRINFTNESTAGTTTRAPQGMSVQKVRNGVWSELYRDDSAPLFVYTPGTPGTNPAAPGFPYFDLSVGAVGGTLKIKVRDHLGNTIDYPLINDTTDPITSGSVGLTTWGTDNVYYSGFGGLNTPLLRTLTSLKDIDLVVDRNTGNLLIDNNDPTVVNIEGIMLQSSAGALKPEPASWKSVANNYDRPSPPTPGNGSVDGNDAWTITSATVNNLSESETVGDGGTIAASGSINLGNAWTKSRLEDLIADLTLADGSQVALDVVYINGPGGDSFSRSDLNTDGAVNATDWPLFFPNMFANLSSFTPVARALKGDLDGDGDNDVEDFSLFKADYIAVNGLPAFEALVGVPEPSALALLALGGLALAGLRRRAWRGTALAGLAVIVGATAGGQSASAAPADLTTYTTENFPPAAGFAVPVWTVTTSTASLPSNADATVLYSPNSALNKRFIGRLTPGTDDDVIGFVIGFEPGDAQIGSTADYLLLDWKGVTQTFEFTDADILSPFHSDTLGGSMPVGLALSRVTGSPTADDLWQHMDLAGNLSGGVTELARGATLGSTAYNRTNGSHVVDITYTATRVTVSVDGVQQLDVAGSFPDGRFGLYSAWQGPTATFSQLEEFSASGFAGLSATVDRTTGDVSLRNGGTDPVLFDFYQLSSASNSINLGAWDSLSDKSFQAVGGGIGQSWDEAGGSSTATLGEVYLRGNSTLAGNATVSLGNIYNNAVNGGDLTLTYRLPTGIVLSGTVRYAGDFDADSDVDGGDFLVWQQQFGGPGSADANSSGLVDGADLAIWRTNFPVPTVAAAAPSGAAVPEASSIGLMMGAAVGLASHRRRSR